MNRVAKGWLTIGVVFSIGFLSGFLVRGCTSGHHSDPVVEDGEVEEEKAPAPKTVELKSEEPASDEPVVAAAQPKEIIYNRKRLPYSKLFPDMNEEHLNVAKKVGLKSVPKNRAEVVNDGLIEIRDNENYVVYDLRYSVPYLVPKAAAELQAIGRAFTDSLRNHGLLEYKLVVSSILRTEEDVTRLRRSGNPNASANSAHCYGTTFDITYTRYSRDDESEAFMQPFELTKVLGEVLRDRRNAGKILVKYEKQEHCFHITVK